MIRGILTLDLELDTALKPRIITTAWQRTMASVLCGVSLVNSRKKTTENQLIFNVVTSEIYTYMSFASFEQDS